MGLRRILAVNTAAKSIDLVTLDRVKLELGISDQKSDEVLKDKITEASSDIAAALGYRVPQETVTETCWHALNEPFDAPEYILLHRRPVTQVNSVLRDFDTTPVDPSRYRLDPETGQLFHLSVDGFPWPWFFVKTVVINYQAGYVLPGAEGCNLPPGIQGAALELVCDFWAAKGRDPSVKSETVFGVDQVDYWIGAVGDPSELPPRVLMKLAPFQIPVYE